MKSAGILALLAVIALSVFVYEQGVTIRNDKDRLSKLEAKLDGNKEARGAPLEYQQKCAEQSAKFYQTTGYTSKDMAGYQNHYSPRLNKCFIEVDATDTKAAKPNIMNIKTVYDAFEGKMYGQYMWKSDQVKKYWDVAPLQCMAVLPTDDNHHCENENEFTTLMKQYIED